MASRSTSIGFRLRKQRKLMGYSIRYVARRVDIAPIRLSQWERNIKRPNIDNLVNLAVLYGAMVDEFVSDIRQDAIKSIHGSNEKYYEKIREKPP